MSALEDSLVREDRTYNPTLRGAVEAIEEARKAAREQDLPHRGNRSKEVTKIVKHIQEQR